MTATHRRRLPAYMSAYVSAAAGLAATTLAAIALPAAASRPGTIRNGDIMLYGDSTLVVFYRTFDSIYSYTRIGKLDGPDDLDKVLGPRDVKVTFSKQ